MKHLGARAAGHIGDRDARSFTMSGLVAAASANGLIAGELYFISDKGRTAIGLSANTYKIEPRIYTQATSPADALPGDIWIETP